MSDIKLFTIDCETTMNGNSDVGLSHPMHKDNRAVLVGEKNSSDTLDPPAVVYLVTIDDPIWSSPGIDVGCDFVVGHNIPFDLQYLYKISPKNKKTFQNCRLWDTQLAEYLLSGQQSRWASLDQLAIKYGLPLKEDKIKKYFEAGIGADKIPNEELIPYLKQDVTNTEAIARIQMIAAVKQDMMPLMISQMEALHATTEMMWNGMHVDKEELDHYTVEVVNEYAEVKLDLTDVAGSMDDVDSAAKWSRFFFGGVTKITEKEAVGLYKNGKTKYKNVIKEVPVKGCFTGIIDEDWKSEKTGKISCDEKVLEVLTKYKDTKEVSEKLLKYRNLSKQLSTYVQGLAKHIQGDYIYGQLNHCSTVTGRLSSAKPNLQNISNNPIKRIFTSRFSDGWLVEVDFAQLEIAALAHITRDKQLIKDIMTGTDIHSALFKEMYGYTPSKEERKPFKSLSFGLIYGAGFKTLAENAKCSVDSAKKFVRTFYDRYPSVAEWHDSFKKKADACGEHLKDPTTGELDKARTFIYTSETHRQYHFKEYYDSKRWSLRDYDYSPTELKNYPVQGLATGDIVPLMLGILFRKFVNQEGVKCVNTIHDSIMFDVNGEAKDRFIEEVMHELGNTHKYFEATFGKPLALKLSAGVSVGRNWYDMKEIEV